MNCQEFSEQATEVARALVMDALMRDAALGHAEGCAACAARLERERALSAALRATAESFGDAGAPARVETALLAAFRAGRDAAREHAVTLPFAPASAAQPHAARFGRSARAAFTASAIAASLLFAFVLVRRAPQQPSAPSGVSIARGTAPISSSFPAVPVETGAQTRPQTDQEVGKGPAPAAHNQTGGVRRGGRGSPARVQRAAGGQSNKKGVTETALAFQIDGGQAVFAEGDSQGATGAAEVASLTGDAAALTDFVPLSAGASSAPLEGGQVVRVEAPRAALASLGLPVDARRAGETVRADLLLAHDGTAHAIRLVR